MEFGYYVTCHHPTAATGSHQTLYRDAIEQAKVAEELGFTSISIPEHHFNNYLMIPSPLSMAAAIGQHTSTVDIVTAVLVLPFYDIRRLAGEITLVDQLVGGRLQLGLGRGAFRYEFDKLECSLEESRDRFSELVPLLGRLLTETEVTHEGQYYGFDESLTIMPRPVREEGPPLYIAALGEGGIKWAVSQGYNLQTTPLRAPFELTQKQAQWFVEARDALPADAPRPVHHMLRNVYVSKDRKDLEEKARLLHENDQQFVNLFETPGTVVDGYTVPIESATSKDQAVSNVIFGTPDEVIESLKVHADLQIDAIQTNMSFGASQKDVLACMQLFAEEVMPELAKDRAGAAA
jgi:alkanesulfonate monooxygenase SsuD/methylene tetrahydromethanopterin reductase-like flavin-dependent oxidoreductase (luciferase family)